MAPATAFGQCYVPERVEHGYRALTTIPAQRLHPKPSLQQPRSLPPYGARPATSRGSVSGDSFVPALHYSQNKHCELIKEHCVLRHHTDAMAIPWMMVKVKVVTRAVNNCTDAVVARQAVRVFMH